MRIDEVVAVSGLPGLFKIGATRSNGLIVEDIDTGKSRFVSVRKHQFTPLATVAIYTDMDTVEIDHVFKAMLEKKDDTPIPSPKSSSKELFDYFSLILPDYDRDQVLISDVKKVIKWYLFLEERGLYPFESSLDEEE
ncbi:MAG: DUF5606 domain-containing protein [Bacteroidota bacterium]